MTELHRAVVRAYDGATHKADVQLVRSLSTRVVTLPVAGDIPASALVAGRECAVLLFQEDNPDDGVLVTVHGFVPSGVPAGARIQDADNDTWIDVENAPDEDKIRLTVAGVLRALLQNTTPEVDFPAGTVRVTDRLGVGPGIPPSTAVRAQIGGFLPDIATDMTQLLVLLDGIQTANRGTAQRLGFQFDPLPYDQGAFTLSRFIGGRFQPGHQLGDALGGVASLTRYIATAFGIVSSVVSGGVETLIRANAIEILPPELVGPFASLPNLAGIFVGNQGHADVTGTSYGVEIDPQSGSPTNVGLALRASAVYPAPSSQNITAATQAITPTRRTHQIIANGSYTLTSAPTIAAGVDGQRVLIINVDTGADVITLQDQGTLAGSNLRLGAATRALGPRDSIELQYNSTVGDWVELMYNAVL